MIGEILQFRDLQELCQPGKRPRLATVERWARDRRIRFQYDASGGIWTTTTALNEALGLAAPASNGDTYSTDLL
ncbi:hypothetical protein [Stenotrophomonas sp. Sm5341]|uniref:hypothetical protein n=1 Tax=Stenotrophomonas sp. Sm5341 TaxID=3002750 RepID=UPI0027E5A682|nr:hypothetical protein [Stenotrophomonas sp. Sm5341]MDQ7284913.1 hypothetical protein [Stenotrophomonas sp. Sm5341]